MGAIWNTFAALFNGLWSMFLYVINQIIYYIVEPVVCQIVAILLNVLTFLLGSVTFICNAAAVGFMMMFDGLAGLIIDVVPAILNHFGINLANYMNSFNTYLQNLGSSAPAIKAGLYVLFDGQTGIMATGFITTASLMLFMLALRLVMRIIRG